MKKKTILPRRERTLSTAVFPVLVGVWIAFVLSILLSAVALAQELSTGAAQQIQALMNEKAARTPVQQKIDSNLLSALKMSRGEAIAGGIWWLETNIPIDDDGKVPVDITAQVSDGLLAKIQATGGDIVNSFPQYHAIRARIFPDQIEGLASDPAITFIRPAEEAMTGGQPPSAGMVPPLRRENKSQERILHPGFAQRAAHVQAQLREALPRLAQATRGTTLTDAVAGKVNTSQGDVAHRANLARSTFGINGTGVKIGVLSDGVDSLATSQGTGDLPATVTVLAGQAGTGDEGTAMLEIVYDLAPGAQLFFATAFSGQAQFAQNILDLSNVYGCDIILDDVFYYAEGTFQDGIVARAVNTVAGNNTVPGAALYFALALNGGNKDKGTSGVWEGDFVNSGTTISVLGNPGQIHSFGRANALKLLSQQDFKEIVRIERTGEAFTGDALGAGLLA